MAKKEKRKASTLEKLTFLVAIAVTIPFSLIYLVFWRGRCAHCGKRIFFNKTVCKKCNTNSHTIVEEFDDKIEMFFQQIAVVEDITDIIGQYSYVVNQFEGINDIYEALDEVIDTKPMLEKTLVYLERTLDSWIERNLKSLKSNPAYRLEIIEEINDLIEDEPVFKEMLTQYLDEIKDLDQV